MSARLDALRRQFTDVRQGIDAIETRATGAGRDLTDQEQTEVDALYARAADLTPQIEEEGGRQDRMSAAAGVLARIQPASPQTALVRSEPVGLPSIGEFMSLHIRARQGDSDAAELLTRVVATEKLADTPGVIPVPIVGQLIKLADDSRPVFNSLTGRPMPSSGKTFNRPRVTQRVIVAEQVAELDELASRKMTITGDAVTKRTFGGTLEISRQDIDWTDPSTLQIAIDDFSGYYANVTEAAACTALVALATATSAYTATSIATIIGSVMTGIQAGYTAAKRVPDTLWLSLDQMIALASNTNTTTNLSALSLLRQTLNDAGITIKIVTGPQLPAGTRILGNSGLIESYEQQLGLLSLPDITHLGVFIAYAGYLAFYGLAAGFVSLA